MKTLEELNQKLIDLSNTQGLVKLVLRNNRAFGLFTEGRICYIPTLDNNFSLFQRDFPDIPFKLEDVIKLSVMTEIWDISK